MDRVEKRIKRIEALARVTQRKFGFWLPGALQIEYAALKRLTGDANA